MSKRTQCLLAIALSAVIVTGCGAPKPPMPSGDRIAINGQPFKEQTQRAEIRSATPTTETKINLAEESKAMTNPTTQEVTVQTEASTTVTNTTDASK